MKTADAAFQHSLEFWTGHSGGQGLVAHDVHDPEGRLKPRSIWLATPNVDPEHVQNVVVTSDGRNALDLRGSLHGGVQLNRAVGPRTAVLAIDHGDEDRIAELGDFSKGGLAWDYARFARDAVSSLVTQYPAMRTAMFASIGSSMGGDMAMHQLLNDFRSQVGISLSGAFHHSSGFNSHDALQEHLAGLDKTGPANRIAYLDMGSVGEPQVVYSSGKVASFLESKGFEEASIFDPASPLHNLYPGVYSSGLGTEHKEHHWAERVRRMFSPDGVFGPDFVNLRRAGHVA